MMTREQFNDEVFAQIVAEFGEGYTVDRQDVRKDNDIMHDAVTVRPDGKAVAPTVYLDNFYELHKTNGWDVKKTATELVKKLKEAMPTEDEEGTLGFYLDWEQVKQKICFRVVSSIRNNENLKEMPHRLIGDLAIIYFTQIDFFGGVGHIKTTNRHMKQWGVTEQDLYEAAMKNTPEIMGVRVETMQDITSRVMEEEVPETGMLVVSSQDRERGAGVVLYPGFLKEMHRRYGCDIYVIPSSVHEMILVPKFEGMDSEYLKAMIKEVNKCTLLPEDVLSDSLYEYDSENDKLQMVS